MVAAAQDYRHQIDLAELEAELDRRMELHNYVAKLSEGERSDLLAHYAKHPIDWIHDWAWTYDPRLIDVAPSPNVPFTLWPRQEELVLWIVARFTEGRHGGLKKSRDWGATWICAAVAVWLWLFKPGSAVTFGSRKQDLVDRLGDMKAIFPKIRHIISNLPGWMLPEGYTSEHDNFCKIINPATGANITGEAGDEMGRGGRSTLYFVDEAAFIERPEKAEAAIGGNADAVIWLSTTNGTGTLFYQKEQMGKIPFFFANWRDDPRKSEAWAVNKRNELGPTIFAREFDMDDSVAEDWLIVPGIWAKACINIELPEDAPHEPIQVGLDVADEGRAENVVMVRRGCYLIFDEQAQVWTDSLTTATGQRAIDFAVSQRATAFAFDRVGVGAGVAGIIEQAKQIHTVRMPRVLAIQGNARPTNTVYWDDPRPAHQRFVNLNAEMWWHVRLRCETTYRWLHGMTTWGVHEAPIEADMLISLPQDIKLLSQLSSRKYFTDSNGKIGVESKKDMRRRGIASPDRADAAAYAFVPIAHTTEHVGVLPVHLQRGRRTSSRHPKTRRPL